MMLVNSKKYTYLIIGFLLYFPFTVWAFDSFDCVGSEPFWKLTIAEQKFTFKQRDEPDIILSAVRPTQAENMSMDHIRVFRTKMDNKDVTIIIQKQSCTDGTSEDIFAYEGLFISTDKVFHGCCSKKLMLSH